MKRARLIASLGAVTVVLFAGLAAAGVNGRLLRTPPDEVPKHRGLDAYAKAAAWPAYEIHCAGCHGADLKGRAAKHTPDLTDGVWLFDDGAVSDIERTISYGVRSGHGKAHNVTDMPAFLFTARLNRGEIADVAEYVEQLSGKPADATMSARGKAIYQVKGVCYDCHAPDGSGQPDYGAPDLRVDRWMWGGDRPALIRSIGEGRHGLCPAWSKVLSPTQIRALAVKLYDASH